LLSADKAAQLNLGTNGQALHDKDLWYRVFCCMSISKVLLKLRFAAAISNTPAECGGSAPLLSSLPKKKTVFNPKPQQATSPPHLPANSYRQISNLPSPSATHSLSK
jgi:hypothetical protein